MKYTWPGKCKGELGNVIEGAMNIVSDKRNNTKTKESFISSIYIMEE